MPPRRARKTLATQRAKVDLSDPLADIEAVLQSLRNDVQAVDNDTGGHVCVLDNHNDDEHNALHRSDDGTDWENHGHVPGLEKEWDTFLASANSPAQTSVTRNAPKASARKRITRQTQTAAGAFGKAKKNLKRTSRKKPSARHQNTPLSKRGRGVKRLEPNRAGASRIATDLSSDGTNNYGDIIDEAERSDVISSDAAETKRLLAQMQVLADERRKVRYFLLVHQSAPALS